MRALGGAGGRALDRRDQRVRLHHHARAAAVRRVVDGAVAIAGEVARVDEVDVEQARGARLAQQAGGQRRLEQLREQRDDGDAHRRHAQRRRTGSSGRPSGGSTTTRRPSTLTSTRNWSATGSWRSMSPVVDDQAILKSGLDGGDHAPVGAVGKLDLAADQVDQQHVFFVEIEGVAADLDRLAAQRGGPVPIGDAVEQHQARAADHRARRQDGVLAAADPDGLDALERGRLRVVQRDPQLPAHAVGASDDADLDPVVGSGGGRSPHRARPVTPGSRPGCACRCAERPR